MWYIDIRKQWPRQIVCGQCGRQKKKWEKVEGEKIKRKNQSRWRSSAMRSLHQEDVSQGRNVCNVKVKFEPGSMPAGVVVYCL